MSSLCLCSVVAAQVKRKAVQTVYESQGLPENHKVPDSEQAPRYAM